MNTTKDRLFKDLYFYISICFFSGEAGLRRRMWVGSRYGFTVTK